MVITKDIVEVFALLYEKSETTNDQLKEFFNDMKEVCKNNTSS